MTSIECLKSSDMRTTTCLLFVGDVSIRASGSGTEPHDWRHCIHGDTGAA